jgi:hypothetical protein
MNMIFTTGPLTEALKLDVALHDPLTLTVDYGQSLHQKIATGHCG